MIKHFYPNRSHAHSFARRFAGPLSGPEGEAMLAIALVGGDKPSAAAGLKKVNSSQEVRLTEALKRLPGREYAKKPKTLVADLKLLEDVEGLDLAQLAFHIRRAEVTDSAEEVRRYFKGKISDEYIRERMPPKYKTAQVNEPVEITRLLSFVREHNTYEGLVVDAPVAELPPMDDLALKSLRFRSGLGSFATNKLRTLESLLVRCGTLDQPISFDNLKTLELHDCALRLGSLPALESLTIVGGAVELPDAANLPALKKLFVRDEALTSVPESYGSLPLEEVRLNGPLTSLPQSFADLGSVKLPDMRYRPDVRADGTKKYFSSSLLERSFGASPIVEELRWVSKQTFVEDAQPADLAGPPGEAMLALALACGDTPTRNLAKKRIKKSTDAHLIAAMEILGKVTYVKKDDSLVQNLRKLSSVEGFNVAQFAHHLSKANGRIARGITQLYSSDIPALIERLEESPEETLQRPELKYLPHPIVAKHYAGLDKRQRNPYFHLFPELALEFLPGDDALLVDVLRANPSLNANAPTFATDEEVPALLRVDSRARKALPAPWAHFADLYLVGGEKKKSLSPQHVERLGKALMQSKGRMTPELQEVRDALDPKSRDDFGMKLYAALPSWGGSSWVFRSLCVLSGDEVVDRLAAEVIKMPYQRAVVALEVLASVGTERAMLRIAHVAAKGRGRGVKNSASNWLRHLAKKRGLTKDQLADRLVPDLGLDADGSLTLDLGPRSFRVGFDEQLKPWVCGEDGKKRASLPKSSKDDAEKSKLAQARWSALKKEARVVASVQIARFEQAMLDGREWSMDEFQNYVMTHPMLRHVVSRLIWRSGDQNFRVDESGQPVDSKDNAFVLGTEPVRLVHAFELSPEELGAWGEVLADYELVQPFHQLQRETFIVGSDASKVVIDTVQGARAKGGSIAGLLNRGWTRGPVVDNGQFFSVCYRATDLLMELTMDRGVNVQGGYGMEEEQTLTLTVNAKEPSVRTYSEAMRSLSQLKLLN